MSEEVLSIGDWRDNAGMIADVARLGFIRGRVLDMTYGFGTFWKLWCPDDLTTNDRNPAKGEHHEDFRATSWASRSFDTVVLDPPYQMRGTPSRPEMDERFGTTESATRNEILCLIASGCVEAARVSDDLVLVKCQDQVEAGKVRWQTNVAYEVMRACEFRLVDTFILRGGRKQPAGTTQKHARHEHSTLLVFGRR